MMELYYLQICCVVLDMVEKIDTFLLRFSELEKAPAVLQTGECRESFRI